MLYEGLQKAAEKKGWKLQGANELTEFMLHMPITIEGEEDGVPIQISRASSLHTLATSALFKPNLTPAFEIAREGVKGAIAGALGIEDVKVGDAAFDDAFRLVSKDAEALKKLLTPAVQAIVRELAAATESFGSHFIITESVVWLQRPNWGTLTEDEVLQDVPLVVRAAKAIAAASR